MKYSTRNLNEEGLTLNVASLVYDWHGLRCFGERAIRDRGEAMASADPQPMSRGPYCRHFSSEILNRRSSYLDPTFGVGCLSD